MEEHQAEHCLASCGARRRWAEEGQYQALRAAVDEAVRLQLPPGVGQPLPRQVIGDRRPAEAEVRPSQIRRPSPLSR